MTQQVEPQALADWMKTGEVKVVDGSWALDGSDMRAAFRQSHIPGAVFFDLDAVSRHDIPLPHMAPLPEQFAAAVGALGISERDPVVVYDRQGLFSAARVWWTFRLMGHTDVRVLRGGLPAWIAAGLTTESGDMPSQPVGYRPNFNPSMVTDLATMRRLVAASDAVILDARPAARFAGTAPEPRAGLRSGHMPGSHSLPASELIRDGALKPVEELKNLLSAHGVAAGAPVVTSCGSGVTAAILSLALDEVGHTPAILYDGSWAEWGQATLDTPVATGES